MSLFLILAFLFSVGSVLGWGLEVLFRRFFSAKHWVNPGFLIGPYLPLYGSSLCLLFLLAQLEPYVSFGNPLLQKLLLFVTMAVAITILEYIAGLIFIKGMKIKLWDYSDRWGNVQGIICPLFSFFWIVLSGMYYFLVHPYILSALRWLGENLAFSFAIGFFYGIFVLDFIYSTQILVKIRTYAAESGIVVRLEELKEDIHASLLERKRKSHFFGSAHRRMSMTEFLENYRKTYFSSENLHISHLHTRWHRQDKKKK